MRLSTACMFSLFLLSPLAMAQSAAPAAAPPPPSPAAMQLALKLYDDTHVDGVFETMTGSMIQNEISAARNVAGDKIGCPALKTPAQAFVQRMTPILANLADPQFRQSVATIYANNLSESDLREITTFLESPAGKKWSGISTQVSQQIFQLAAEKAKSREPQVKQAYSDFETSFKNTLATCPASSSPQAAPAPAKKRTH